MRDNNKVVSTTSYAYNYVGNITSQKNYNASGKLLSEFSYTYDLNGNVLSEYDSTTKKITNYVYDILGRLVSETDGGTSRHYAYDVSGNRIKAIIDTTTTISYNYDRDGRLISETSNNGQTSAVTTYAYDNNGNLISKTENGKTTKYVFDVWGNMTSAAGASYTYNTQGLRTSKTVSGKKTSFTLVGGNVWSDGTANYIWGAELITNGSVYYIYNAHGDVIQLLNASGKVTKTYDYDAYGNELERDLADENPFRYCGEYYDTETGFIYLRARYYDPAVGRFISKDTHWNVGNMIYGDTSYEHSRPNLNAIQQSSNQYVYCMNNPTTYIDSNGEISVALTIIIGVGIGALVNGGIKVVDNIVKGETWHNGLFGAVVSGGISGGIAIVGSSLESAIILGAIGNFLGQWVTGQIESREDAGVSLAIGAFAGAVGYGAEQLLVKIGQSIFSNLTKASQKSLLSKAMDVSNRALGNIRSSIKRGESTTLIRDLFRLLGYTAAANATTSALAANALQSTLYGIEALLKKIQEKDGTLSDDLEKIKNIY